MIRVCIACGADLGPWEAPSCLSCQFNALLSWPIANSDAGVRILEREGGPLSIYDIQRGIRREFGKEVLRGSLTVSLSLDPRFCWAGKGLYGLYRHRLVPGPRNLAGVAKFFLYSFSDVLPLKHLSFLMKYVGYRFQDQSLVNALTYEPAVHWVGRQACAIPENGTTRATLRDLGFAPTDFAFDDMVMRCQDFIADGLVEFDRRMKN